MTEKTQLFQFAGERPAEKTEAEKKKKWYQDRPVAAELFLGLLVLGCLFCGQIMTKDPSYMDLKNCSVMPCREFLFGTDTMGRDIFSMIWYGGRISLAIGLLSTLISTVIAVLFGAVSGCAPAWLDALLMRLTEIFLSVPNLLLVIFLLAAAGKSNVITISAVIGMTSWTSIAKVVRTEVRQIRNSEYVIASRCMGGSFFYILWHHLAPNFFFVYYVYGGYEHPKCDCSRIHTEFYGNRSSSGGDFLGQHAVAFGKSADDKGMVDHSDPGCFSDCDAA